MQLTSGIGFHADRSSVSQFWSSELLGRTETNSSYSRRWWNRQGGEDKPVPHEAPLEHHGGVASGSVKASHQLRRRTSVRNPSPLCLGAEKGKGAKLGVTTTWSNKPKVWHATAPQPDSGGSTVTRFLTGIGCLPSCGKDNGCCLAHHKEWY